MGAKSLAELNVKRKSQVSCGTWQLPLVVCSQFMTERGENGSQDVKIKNKLHKGSSLNKRCPPFVKSVHRLDLLKFTVSIYIYVRKDKNTDAHTNAHWTNKDVCRLLKKHSYFNRRRQILTKLRFIW